MFNSITPFGNEIRFLNETIETATHKRYSLSNKGFIKHIFRFIGLPHFGARLRVYHLNKLLNGFPQSQRFLDAGCGIGLNTFLLGRRGYQVIGIDNDRTKISLARKMLIGTQYKNVSFKISDLTKNNLSKKKFDSVLCFEVLEHIKEDDKALTNISKSLKENGTMFLSVPGKGVISRINRACKDHVREGYSFSQLQKKMKKHNFVIKKIVGIEHTPIGFMARYINDEVGRRSLLLVTLLVPLLLPIAIVDYYLPTLITPNNWIIVAKKNP